MSYGVQATPNKVISWTIIGTGPNGERKLMGISDAVGVNIEQVPFELIAGQTILEILKVGQLAGSTKLEITVEMPTKQKGGA